MRGQITRTYFLNAILLWEKKDDRGQDWTKLKFIWPDIFFDLTAFSAQQAYFFPLFFDFSLSWMPRNEVYYYL